MNAIAQQLLYSEELQNRFIAICFALIVSISASL